MHAIDLAAVSSWVFLSQRQFSENNNALAWSVRQYWISSKCRLQRWHTALRMFADDLNHPAVDHDPWPAIRAVVEEVLVAEISTRLWTEMATSYWHLIPEQDPRGLTHAVAVGHLEARNRCLRLLISGRGQNEKVVDQLDAVRRHAELWAQQMLFPNKRQADEHEIASMVDSLQPLCVGLPANPDLNRQIAAGILGVVPCEIFSTDDVPPLIERTRLQVSGETATLLVDALLAEG